MNRCRNAFAILAAGGFLLAGVAPAAADEAADALRHARDLIDGGVWFEAVEKLRGHLDGQPDDIAARIELAQLLFRLGRYRDAVETVMPAPRDDPRYGQARRLLLMRSRMRVARDVDWRDPDAVIDFARLCARMESYDRAARCYQLAIDLRDRPALRREYAAMLAWAGRYDEAVRQYRRYLEAEPGDAAARGDLGRALIALDRLDEAGVEIAEALRSRPGDAALHLDYIRLAIWQGRLAIADRLLTEFIESRADMAVDARLLRAELLLREDRVEEADALLRELIGLAPDEPRAAGMLRELTASRRVEIAALRRRLHEGGGASDREALIELLLAVGRPGAALREMELLALARSDDQALRRRVEDLRLRRRAAVIRLARERQARRDLGSGLSIEDLREWTERHAGDERAARLYSEALRRLETPWDGS